jgi:CHAT domain-containing protein
VFFPENPLFSCLLLSRDKKHDGRLEAYEILGQRIETELVVLSACQTGLGRVLSGDEVIGLNRSFLYAGTPSIISTLWMVDDVAQAVLLKKFYRYLKHENSPSRALRKAKISTMRFFPHPASWAGLCLTGAF